jgi:hypothetical protein
MDVILPAQTIFYRVTAAHRPWSDVLTGRGAFYGHPHGARYNASRQTTVYTSTDPVVVITEAAFYQALLWHARIGSTVLRNQHLVSPPFVSTVRLWSFRLTRIAHRLVFGCPDYKTTPILVKWARSNPSVRNPG